MVYHRALYHNYLLREVARIIRSPSKQNCHSAKLTFQKVEWLETCGIQLRENLHQSLSVIYSKLFKRCWWETKQVCILKDGILEVFFFGRTEVPGIDWWGSLNAVDGRNSVQKWPLYLMKSYEIIWNHLNCLAESFFQWISDWELTPISCFGERNSVALPWGPSYVPRKTPIHWNLELTEPHLSQCIFGRTPNFWSCRSSGWNDKCLGFCHMTMKVTSDSAPFTAEVVRLDHFPADRCATFWGKYRWRKVAICNNHRPQEQHHQQNNHNNIIIINNNKFIKWHTALTKPGTRRLELRPWTS